MAVFFFASAAGLLGLPYGGGNFPVGDPRSRHRGLLCQWDGGRRRLGAVAVRLSRGKRIERELRLRGATCTVPPSCPSRPWSGDLGEPPPKGGRWKTCQAASCSVWRGCPPRQRLWGTRKVASTGRKPAPDRDWRPPRISLEAARRIMPGLNGRRVQSGLVQPRGGALRVR